jgi:coenzyme F420-reducing hydrogenase alpha subunit
VTRLSLSDVVAAQEAMIERQAKQLEALTRMHADTLAALTERRTAPTASESVTIKRAGIGDKPTTIDVSAVVQDGETLEDARRRASIEYEKAAARFPLPNGYAHAAPLGEDENPRLPPTLVEQLSDTLRDRAKDAKDGAE